MNRAAALEAVAVVALGPWLWLQGRRVRRQTPKLPEPPGPRHGRVALPPVAAPAPFELGALGLLLTGDSAAAGVGVAHQNQALAGQLPARLAQHYGREVVWDLVARTGLDVQGLANLLRTHRGDLPYEIVLVSVGVNEVTAGTGVRVWRTRLEDLHRLLRDRFRAQLVVYSGIPPMHRFPALPQPLRWFLGRRARRLDQALAQWAAATPGANGSVCPNCPIVQSLPMVFILVRRHLRPGSMPRSQRSRWPGRAPYAPNRRRLVCTHRAPDGVRARVGGAAGLAHAAGGASGRGRRFSSVAT